MRISSTILRSAQINGSGIATDYLDRQQSWSQLVDKVRGFAGGLQKLGVRPGDRVAMLALNSDRYLEYFLAVPWAGAVVVPINTRLAPPEFVHWLNDSGATVLLIDEHLLPQLQKFQDQLESVKTIVFVGEGVAPEGMPTYQSTFEHADGIDPLDSGGDELAALFYTGGTTGRSKGVMLSHRNVLLNSMQFASDLGFAADSVYLHAAPMFHIANGAAMFAIISSAGTSTIITAFEPTAALEAIQNKKVSTGLMVPTMVNMMVNHPTVGDYDLSGLRDLAYGASPMPEAVVTRAMEILPNTRFHHVYGQTEAAPVLTALPVERHVTSGAMAGKIKSAGQAILGVEIRIVDEADNVVERGTVGQICARGENVMLGYWKQPELSAQTLRGGWLHTGDGGYMDEEGFVFIVDRVKDMIISGGENVYSAEVENAIYEHAAVVECAVIGIPHEKWGEQVHAIVRCKAGDSVSEQALIDHCHEVIAGYKCPRSVDFVSDPLPLSGAGKILKTELRKPYWEGKAKQVN
jgi:acyl-CoA synthetase (AMP-forming)/AMP-acid ligase II